MGKPENPEDYLAIQVGEWARRYGTIYVPWEMWKGLQTSTQEFLFCIENHGRFRLASTCRSAGLRCDFHPNPAPAPT